MIVVFVFLLLAAFCGAEKPGIQPEVSFVDSCFPRDPFFCADMSAGWLYSPFLKSCSYTPSACTKLLWDYKSKCEFCATGIDPTDVQANSPDNFPSTYTPVCSLVMDSGEYCGLTPMKRWHWDPSQEKCVEFDYAGCAGNSNNFPTQTACHVSCSD